MAHHLKCRAVRQRQHPVFLRPRLRPIPVEQEPLGDQAPVPVVWISGQPILVQLPAPLEILELRLQIDVPRRGQRGDDEADADGGPNPLPRVGRVQREGDHSRHLNRGLGEHGGRLAAFVPALESHFPRR